MMRSLLGALCIGMLSLSVNAQHKIVWERYTTAWVTGKTGANEQRPTKELPSSLKPKHPGVSLFFPERGAFVEHPNGNRYINAYLVNASPDTVAISRADATLSNLSTEIYVDGQWKIFQTATTSSCGNSYWTMALSPQRYLHLELENKTKGPIEVAYRIWVRLANGGELVSNATRIGVSKALLKMAGTLPSRISL